MTQEIRELLGEDLAKQVEEKLGDQKLIVDTGNLVDTKSEDFAKQWTPRSVYNADKKSLQDQLDERNKDLEELKEQAKGGEALKTKISELEQKYQERDKAAKAELDKQQRRHAIEVELMKQGCDAPELIAPMIDTSKLIDLGDGNFSGMKDLIEPMKEKYKNNFAKITATGDPPKPDPDKANQPETFNGKKAEELNLTEQMMLKKTKPELYAKMFQR